MAAQCTRNRSCGLCAIWPASLMVRRIMCAALCRRRNRKLSPATKTFSCAAALTRQARLFPEPVPTEFPWMSQRKFSKMSWPSRDTPLIKLMALLTLLSPTTQPGSNTITRLNSWQPCSTAIWAAWSRQRNMSGLQKIWILRFCPPTLTRASPASRQNTAAFALLWAP